MAILHVLLNPSSNDRQDGDLPFAIAKKMRNNPPSFERSVARAILI